MLTDCGQKTREPTAYRQWLGADAANSALNKGIFFAIHTRTTSYDSSDNVP
jgi:hypothetical protein